MLLQITLQIIILSSKSRQKVTRKRKGKRNPKLTYSSNKISCNNNSKPHFCPLTSKKRARLWNLSRNKTLTSSSMFNKQWLCKRFHLKNCLWKDLTPRRNSLWLHLECTLESQIHLSWFMVSLNFCFQISLKPLS